MLFTNEERKVLLEVLEQTISYFEDKVKAGEMIASDWEEYELIQSAHAKLI
jgi:hypothetical protein